MLEQILKYINNFFVVTTRSVTAIAQAKITVDDASDFVVGQYVYLNQSKLNDGVYKIIEITGNDLTFDPADDVQVEPAGEAILYGLAIPKAVLALKDEITTYNTANPNNLQSETLGDYSATYAAGKNASWTAAFASRLAPYRRVYLNLPRTTKKWL